MPDRPVVNTSAMCTLALAAAGLAPAVSRKLVAVITSSAYNRSYAHPQSRRILTGFLLPALD